MANLSKTTKDHEEIRRWAEERGGKPSHVKSTSSEDEVGILRIDFPGFSGAGSLEEIPWDDFFEKFDDQNLALVYQEETADGERSNFNKLVSGDSVETDEEAAPAKKGAAKRAGSSGRKTAAKQSGAKKAASPSRTGGAAKKSAPAKKGAVKKAAPAKTAATKSSAAKTAAKTQPAKKQPAKKAAAKQAAAKKLPAKKVGAKKVVAKKQPAKKVPAKKAVKKTASRGRR